MLLSSWVDNQCLQQQPQFNYGDGLGRDLRNAGVHIDNWASLASDCNIWHTITQQKNVYCNTNGSGYVWVDQEQLTQAAAENTLPSPLPYAGVLLAYYLCSMPGAHAWCPHKSLACNVQPCKTAAAQTDHSNTLTHITSFFITVCSPKSCTTAL
jgi:hypothetical protein